MPRANLQNLCLGLVNHTDNTTVRTNISIDFSTTVGKHLNTEDGAYYGMHQEKPQLQGRQIRGLAIVSIGSQIKRINKLHYKVQSQSENQTWYDVARTYETGRGDSRQIGEWTCNCPDFQYRRIVCKHIYAVGFSKELRRKIVSQDVVPSSVSPLSSEIECPKCKLSDGIVKDGRRLNKCGAIQKYLCRSCDYRFIVNIGFEFAKKNPKIISAAIDLYFKGVSLRKVADHIKKFYSVDVDQTSVLRWLRRFADEVAPFVDSLTPPHLSGIYHVDEMMVHVRREEMEKGHYQWLWNLMDDTTRFWISSKISQRREVADARAVFQDAKDKSTMPKAIIHDGLPSYNEAYQKEYYTLKNPRVKNIRSISVRNEGLNSRVERLNGTMRDREKVMRGMHSAESAQKIIEAMRIHYNYCREHSKLGTTPAEQAGIKLELGENKVESLMRLAAKTG
jgi:putative transposase